MHELGVYPEAFFIDDLMTLHNALVVEYQEQDSRNWKEVKKDMKTLSKLAQDSNPDGKDPL
jgi:hypothetical protein